jgi:hypothetical protein
MPEDANNAIVSDDEIQAALAEAEQEGRIPSLDESAPDIVPVPVPVEANQQPVATTRPVEDTPPRVVAVTETEMDQPDEAATPFEPPQTWWGRLAWAVYRALDATLWLINRPFQFAGPDLRHLIGVASLVTIAVSLLCLYALPALLPNRTVVHHLHDQSTALLTPPPPGPFANR